MNHFSNKKFNLITFGKSAITIGSLTLPVLISTNANSMIRNPRTASMFIKLGGGTSSSSVKTANTLKTSTSTGNTTTPRSNLSGESYKKMAIINTGKSSPVITSRIASLQSSNISTTSSTSTPLPIPKGTVANLADRFGGNSTAFATLSSGFSTQSSPTGNVNALAQRFINSSTSTTSHTSSIRTSVPSGNVALLAKNFTSSSASTTSPSGSNQPSTPTGNVARIAKMFGN